MLPRVISVSGLHGFQLNGDQMSVLVYIVLTVAIFGLFGLAQKLVERL
jgi:hypothetical protein